MFLCVCVRWPAASCSSLSDTLSSLTSSVFPLLFFFSPTLHPFVCLRSFDGAALSATSLRHSPIYLSLRSSLHLDSLMLSSVTSWPPASCCSVALCFMFILGTFLLFSSWLCRCSSVIWDFRVCNSSYCLHVSIKAWVSSSSLSGQIQTSQRRWFVDSKVLDVWLTEANNASRRINILEEPHVYLNRLTSLSFVHLLSVFCASQLLCWYLIYKFQFHLLCSRRSRRSLCFDLTLNNSDLSLYPSAAKNWF